MLNLIDVMNIEEVLDIDRQLIHGVDRPIAARELKCNKEEIAVTLTTAKRGYSLSPKKIRILLKLKEIVNRPIESRLNYFPKAQHKVS